MCARKLTLRGLVCLCALAGVASLGSASALAARGHVFSSSFGAPCPAEPCGGGQFKEAGGVAVDESTDALIQPAAGDVYVVDRGRSRVERFSAAGVYLGSFDGSGTYEAFEEGEVKVIGGTPAPTGKIGSGAHNEPAGVAVDNSKDPADPSAGDVYVTDPAHRVVDKFSSTGAYLGQITGASGVSYSSRVFFALHGVAVDPSGQVWVTDEHDEGADSGSSWIDRFSNAVTNDFIVSQRLPIYEDEGLAVDSKDNLYIQSGFFSESLISKWDSEGELLSNAVDPELSRGVAVESLSDDVYVDNIGSVGRFSPDGLLIERLSVAGMHGSGVAVNAGTGVVYVADSAANVVNVFSLAGPSAATVESESVSSVTANSATFSADINARGAATEYHFEYGRCASPGSCASSAYETSVPVPSGVTASDFEVHSVSVHPQDLVAHTTYHFRVVANNGLGAGQVVGNDETFITQTAGNGFSVADGREWEMVSPPDKHGASLEAPVAPRVIQAASDGRAFTYLATSPTEAEPLGFQADVQVFSTRSANGWGTRDLTVPHGAGTAVGAGVGIGEEYRFFSSDLSLSVMHPFGSFVPSLSGEASERTAYLHTNYLGVNVGDPCVSGCYRPLVTGKPGFANVTSANAFGQEGTCTTMCGPRFIGATPDLSHVVLESQKVGLTSMPGDEGGLYEWAGGGLSLVSVLPGGEPAQFKQSVPLFGLASTSARHALSDDGSRVVWSLNSGSSYHELYLRDMVRKETVQLDLNQGGSGVGNAAPVFQVASADGSRVLFTDTQRLTADSGASESARDLYECDMMVVGSELKCSLSDLTPLGGGGPAGVLGGVLGASSDGAWVYFVANGVLAPGAVPGKCNEGSSVSGASCDLYVRHGGVTSLVAVLSGTDWFDWQLSLASQPVRVSGNGEWLAFMSQASLTGYDNVDAVSGQPDAEVFLYHAGSGGGGVLRCASCNPTGARPAGRQLLDSPFWPGGSWVAANVPGWGEFALNNARYQSRYLSDSGRLFFNSSDALVPQDVNGTVDVYEYEPPGVGGCSQASVTFSERSGGCVGLISSGGSAGESVFMDASETGGDVFFLTYGKLSGRDVDTSLDVYDAHVCGVVSPCFPAAATVPPACSTGDACKAAPSPQPSVFGDPASATFSGIGNPILQGSRPVVARKGLTRSQKLAQALRACHKKRGRRRGVCERRARARFAARKSSAGSASGKGWG